VKVRVWRTTSTGSSAPDLVSVSREEFPLLAATRFDRQPAPHGRRGHRPRTVDRPERLPADPPTRAHRGKAYLASNGEWFICQVDSEHPVKDPNVERNIERIEKFSADGRTRALLAIGSYPVLYETRGEVYFYRDVDEQGEAVRPGLFAVKVDGTQPAPRLPPAGPVQILEGGWRFLHCRPRAVSPGILPAASPCGVRRGGARVRFTVTLEGQLVEQHPD